MTSKRVLPSRAQLTIYKARLVGAKKGYELLKKKLDGLKKRFREIMKDILTTKGIMGKEMRIALYSLAEANYGAGDFAHKLIEAVKRASLQVSMGQSNVAGVYIPVFHAREDESASSDFSQIGITGGGQAISKSKEK